MAKVRGGLERASFCAARMLFFLSALSANAGQTNAEFNVTVDLRPASHQTLCRNVNPPGAFGATVVVVCSIGATVHVSPSTRGIPWAPMLGGAYRHNFLAATVGDQLGGAVSDVGTGTVSSWRVVQISDWDYLEMLMSW